MGQIVEDPAVAEAEAAGHNASAVLTRRTLDDAHSPARALAWLIHHLADRPQPGPPRRQ
ncbi:hypothetical protein [Streptomyces griseoviridis]|uniref:hypothetical protein n=1 Tax=Streptomyces griseoviridis TaxID=45398 RepID=UPI003427C825